MRLSTVCNSCNERTSIKSKATDRPELIKDKGENFNIQCGNCNKNLTIHVNDVRAQPDVKILAFAGFVGILITIILWVLLGAVGTISLGIPILIWAQQNKAVHDFNRYMTRR